ncbi:hypothetical protein [Bifidobacterium sp. ESL0704]|uniref:hypothetical protein n=1 Tax=Bifidobacterium sp. ESL0704 TaxID=2983219 RepID=UPI0023F8BB5F|nr:hypothetical protein [Bifidobacterium sp. ESL0704]WEV52240.1 hypothetical protein OZX64_04815 [Bifidobacterium sp. ESL0704]
MKKKSIHNTLISGLSMFCVATILLQPTLAFAWGPNRETFTMKHPATYPTLDSITDNPDVGDELNFFRVSEAGQKGWSDTAIMQQDKEYFARVYVRNASADNLNLAANEVRAMINMPTRATTWGRAFDINAYLCGSNTKPSEIWDNIVLRSNRKFHVKILSANYYNNYRTEDTSGFPLGDSLFSTGSLLGYDKMDGTIGTSYKDSGYVLVKFVPVMKDPITAWMEDNMLDKLSGAMTHDNGTIKLDKAPDWTTADCPTSQN